MLTRRWTIRVGTILGICIGIAVYGIWFLPSGAQSDDRSIAIVAVKFSDSGFFEEGESCGFSADPLRLLGTNEQIIVRDESDKVIAMFTLDGGEWSTTDTPGKLECQIEHDLLVPEAEFYSVHLGDERIKTYAASELPVSNPFDRVWILFD